MEEGDKEKKRTRQIRGVKEMERKGNGREEGR